MKKAKTTGKPGAQRRRAGTAAAAKKVRARKPAGRAVAPARQASGEAFESAITDLVAVTAELRELVDELRALVGPEENGEEEIAVVVSETEGPEDFE